MVYAAVEEIGVPVEGLLAMMIAESTLNPLAERWGRRTREAQMALEREDWRELQAIALDTWPDLSWGYTQQICLYHWYGDQTSSLDNILAVRKATFANPARDILEASYKLSSCIGIAGGDILTGLLVYNWGHIPLAKERQTSQYASSLAGYTTALVKAEAMLANGGGGGGIH